MNLDHLPIPEADLLDYVEGKLPGTRRVEVAAALRRHPDLARVVAAMQDDRRVFASMPIAAAPTGMLERVEARLEREALLGMGTANLGGTLPVSKFDPNADRPSVIGRILSSHGTRRLAMAAMLAVVVGGAAWSITIAVRQMLPSPVVRVVTNEPATPEPVTPDAGSVEVANAAANSTDLPVSVVPESTNLELASAELVGPDPVVAAMDVNPLQMSPERALELARQGRLAVVVRSSDTVFAAKRVDRLATLAKGEGESGRLHQLEAGALPTGLTALASLWSPRAIEPAAPTAIASDVPKPALAGTEHATATATARSRPVAVYAIEVDDEEAALAALRPAISSDGQTGPRVTAEFIRLDEPVEATPSTDPAAVLWWSGPPSRWTWRWTVPILVEQK